jgi:hypothetical protein
MNNKTIRAKKKKRAGEVWLKCRAQSPKFKPQYQPREEKNRKKK